MSNYFSPEKYLILIFLFLLGCQETPKKRLQRSKQEVTKTVIKIGLIDANICQLSHYKKYENTKIIGPYYVDQSIPSPKCALLPKFKKNLQGHFLLVSLLREIDKDHELQIYPVVVFDKKNKTLASYWSQAFNYLNTQNVDLVLSSSALVIKNKEMPVLYNLRAPLFIKSGQYPRRSRRRLVLWPQVQKSDSILRIGSFRQSTKHKKSYDKSLIGADDLVYFAEGNLRGNPLKKSELAAALFLGRSINRCFRNLNKTIFLNCVKNESIPFKFDDQMKSGKTFPRIF